MKYVFFGSPRFAEIILKRLISMGFIPEAVVTNPDRPVGRKKILTAPPVKILAVKHEIVVLQPESLEIENWKLEIKKIKQESFDFFIVAAYSKILPKEIIDLPRLGTIGVHPSLLPKYRGASPIQGAILQGETETGVTLYCMDEKVDHGPILTTNNLQLTTNDNYETALEKLAKIAGDLLVETIPKFMKGEIEPQEQDHTKATFTKKFKTEDAFVTPELLKKAETEGGEAAVKIHNMIRALNPEPGAWTMQNGKRIKLLETRIKDGLIRLSKTQHEGKNPTILTSDRRLV